MADISSEREQAISESGKRTKTPLSLKETIRKTQLGVTIFLVVVVATVYASLAGLVPKEAVLPILIVAFVIYFYFFWGWFTRFRAWQKQFATHMDDVDQALIMLGGVVIVFVIASILAYFLISPMVF